MPPSPYGFTLRYISAENVYLVGQSLYYAATLAYHYNIDGLAWLQFVHNKLLRKSPTQLSCGNKRT